MHYSYLCKKNIDCFVHYRNHNCHTIISAKAVVYVKPPVKFIWSVGLFTKTDINKLGLEVIDGKAPVANGISTDDAVLFKNWFTKVHPEAVKFNSIQFSAFPGARY